jgi:hypothetical protein
MPPVWTPTGANKVATNHEETWTLLPNGKVLTVDCYIGVPYPSDPTGSETYDPATGSWSAAGSTIVPLDAINPETASFPYSDLEIGAAVLRPDGTVFAIGANGNTAIYDTATETWQVGPMLPVGPGSEGQLGQTDGPAALLPNGNVLLAASPADPFYVPPVHIFEFDGTQYIEQPKLQTADAGGCYTVNMVVLPTGQILTTDFSLQPDIEIYTPTDTSYNSDWAPKIDSAPEKVQPGSTYKISGIRFNGMSQGASYGDDYQSATNYPLVRITNCKTGHVFYCRTHDHSFMGVASDREVYTYFDVPYNIERGKSRLEVVANGIPSKPVTIKVKG